MKKSITYFEKPGPQNTDAVIAAVKERISEGDVRGVVVASESGRTALALAEALKDSDAYVICVAPYPSYQHVLKRGWPPIREEIRRKLESLGGKVLDQTPWIFGCTFDTAFLQDSAPATIIHKFLSRAFGFGVKTCIEVALIAVEAGALEWNKNAIAVAGTGWLGGGADAAIVVRPSAVYGGAFLKNEGGLEVREIVAMPRVKFSGELIARMKKAGKDEPI